jgi:hypothetical protein
MEHQNFKVCMSLFGHLYTVYRICMLNFRRHSNVWKRATAKR